MVTVALFAPAAFVEVTLDHELGTVAFDVDQA